MKILAIPVEGKLVLYRPLLRLAFVGNKAMADLTFRLAELVDTAAKAAGQAPAEAPAPAEAMAFLQAIGFLRPDPPPPLPLDLSYRPAAAVLLLTSRCNLRCTYCYANGGESPVQDLTLPLARAAIDHVCQNALEKGKPYFELTFHGGGEPVRAWETLQQATDYARRRPHPCRMSMVSNGVWRAEQRDWILHNLDGLSISFDGRPETQNGQRPLASGQGSFRAVMRTIKELDKAKFSYGIRMTATSPWQERLPEDVRFICQETGCSSMQVEPAFNARRGEQRWPTFEEARMFVGAFMEAFEIARQAGRYLTYSGARPWLLTRAFCTAPYDALVVNPDGNLVACYEIASESHALAQMSTIGHVMDGRAFIDEQARGRILNYLAEKRAQCEDCFAYWHCAGDCYTRSFGPVQGVRYTSSPRCYINREITARILLWYIMDGDGVWQGQKACPPEPQPPQTF